MGKEQYNIRKGMEVENTKNTYFSRQIFCALNQFAVIIYLSYMAYNGHYIESNYLVHFLSLSLLFFDAAYISYKNVKCNKVLNHFSLLLLLLGWQFLLYLFDFQPISKAVSMLLLPVCFYQSAYFIQTFLFQGSAYRGQKALLAFLKISCVTAIICFFFSDRAFFTAYQLQFFISTLALAVVGIIQRKRIVFVLKSQRKRLLFPLALVVIPFVIYLFVFHREAEYMASMGSYIPVMLAFVCIHSIVFQYHPQQVQFLTLSGGYIVALVFVGLVGLVGMAYLFQIPLMAILMSVYIGGLTDEDGLMLTQHLLERFPDQKIVILSGYNLPVYRKEAKRIGARGFISKDVEPDELLHILLTIKDGATHFPREEVFIEELTDGERKVLELVASGVRRREIAEQLFISERTVSNHLQHIFEKLQVSSTVEMITKAIKLGYIAQSVI